MNKNNASKEREKFYVLWSAIVGITVGFVGNIFANYLYDIAKSSPWNLWFAIVFIAIFLVTIVCMFIQMAQLAEKLS